MRTFATFILLFSIAAVSVSQGCESILCNLDTAQEGEICVKASSFSGQEVFTECADDLICDTFYTQSCVRYNDATRKALPGGACWTDDQCISGKCKGSYCQGVQVGNKCIDSRECDIGLFCSSMGVCNLAQGLNSPCKSNAECRLDLVCDYGTCTEMFSLLPGTKTSEYGVDEIGFLSSYQTLSCSSGWAYPTNASDPLSNKICASAAPTIVNRTTPYKCKGQNDACVYAFQNTNFTFNVSCSCSNDANGGSYCPIVPANERNYTSVVKEFVKNATHCSTSAKNNWMMCGDVVRDSASWKNLISIYYEAYKWNTIVNTVGCVKHTSPVVLYWWSQENVQPIVDNANLVTITTGLIVAIIVGFISL